LELPCTGCGWSWQRCTGCGWSWQRYAAPSSSDCRGGGRRGFIFSYHISDTI
ncbi:hypothetical protein L9F63_000941, partial [Diploptera punctata]